MTPVVVLVNLARPKVLPALPKTAEGVTTVIVEMIVVAMTTGVERTIGIRATRNVVGLALVLVSVVSVTVMARVGGVIMIVVTTGRGMVVTVDVTITGEPAQRVWERAVCSQG